MSEIPMEEGDLMCLSCGCVFDDDTEADPDGMCPECHGRSFVSTGARGSGHHKNAHRYQGGDA